MTRKELEKKIKAMVIGSVNDVLHRPAVDAGAYITDDFKGHAIDDYVAQIMLAIDEYTDWVIGSDEWNPLKGRDNYVGIRNKLRKEQHYRQK